MRLSVIAAKASLLMVLASVIQIAPAKDDPAAQLIKNPIPPATAHSMENSELKWYDAGLLTIEGRAFRDTETSYSRLDLSYKADVTPDVWLNAKSAAGVTVRFVTDSTTISASWDNHAPMGHMAWSGSGGLDLYARENSQWVFRGIGMPTSTTAVATVQKPAGLEKTPTEYMVFLPLYSPVHKLEIGIDAGCHIAPAADRYSDKRPIVFYGTSITQGGCASRAGMSHTSLLRRWLDYPLINLGFSGSGKCEMAMSNVLAEIPASVYVIETVPNMTAQMVNERVVPFIENLCKKQPQSPILMVESPNAKDREANLAWRQAYENLQSKAISRVLYLRGDKLYQGRENPTVDGVHPTDLGFYQMAQSYEPELRKILMLPESSSSQDR